MESNARSSSSTSAAQDAIAAEFAKLVAESAGRGPERIAVYVQPDYVLVVMRGVMSRAEQTLARMGNAALAGHTRLIFHETLRERLKELVEANTGSRVLTALPQFDQDQDILTEVLLLDSESGGEAS